MQAWCGECAFYFFVPGKTYLRTCQSCPSMPMSNDRVLSLLCALEKLLLDEEGGADCSVNAAESLRGNVAAELTQQQLLQQLLLVSS